MARALNLGYVPRLQFVPFHKRTQRWVCIVCHRRAGKTYACIHDLVDAVVSCRHSMPRYAYICPLLKQGKGVAWDHLRQACGVFPKGWVEFNEAELRVDFPHNGGRIRIYGADNPDALRGLYFDGVVFDEYADMDPRTWTEIVRPALNDRKGWAVFIGTPRGHNAFWAIWNDATKKPEEWYSLMLKASESRIIDQKELDDTKATQTEDQYAQEYECSFEDEDRICSVPYDPSVPVWTAWDLGYRDATAIWFAQVVGKEVHIIDYYEASGVDLGHYVRELRSRPYIYARHILPPDAEAHELSSGKSRVETLLSLGLFDQTILPKQDFLDGINAARLLIPKCYFNNKNEGVLRGLEALTVYRSQTDDKSVDPLTKQPILKKGEVHDWASHAGAAFRYLAQGIDDTGFYSRFYKPIDYPPRGIV